MSTFTGTSSAIEMMVKGPGNHALMEQFLGWQCRVRQIAMRDHQGRPDDAVTPAVTLPGNTEPFGNIITVFSKWGAYSKTPELKHMVKQTHDPAQRREKALTYFSSTYFQKAREFTDTLSATFQPESVGARRLIDAGSCSLLFEAYSQQYRLQCKVVELSKTHPLYQSTWWHNLLFNPELHPDTIILGFTPDWDKSENRSLVP